MRVWIVVGGIVIAATVLNVLGVLAPVIEFLAVGSLVAFVEAPIVNALERHGVPRGLGALIGLVVVIAAVVCVVMVIAPPFIEQFMEIMVNLPSQLRQLGDLAIRLSQEFSNLRQAEWADQIDTALSSLADLSTRWVTQLASSLGEGMFPFIQGFASTLFIVFLGLVLAYWLARDYPRIHREMGTIVGEGREMNYRFLIAIISRSIGGYMRGMVVTSIMGGILAFIGFLIIGHPYAALMGVSTGILHLIPVVGPWVSAAVATVIAFFDDPMLAVWTLVVTMVAQNITDNVISPKVMQSSVQVHPAMSLTALIVGSALMGPLGMVVAIPLCAAAKGVFIFYFENDTKRQIVSNEGAIFRGTQYLDEDGKPIPAFDALGDDTFVAESQLIDEDAAPQVKAVHRPESTATWPKLDNPWPKLPTLQMPQIPLHRHGEASADGKDAQPAAHAADAPSDTDAAPDGKKAGGPGPSA